MVNDMQRKKEMIAGRGGDLQTRVSVIPATKPFVQNGGQLNGRNHLRISAYCRVSTGDESQQTSFTKQNEFYRELIAGREEWLLVEIYADEAISGTSRKRRKQFNRMMEDAKAGRMDYIITKSISRFARNTVDTLECVRELKQQDPPVGIYFEKENIDTLDAKGELILTILSALAQEESRSISDNIRWTFQKNFQNGKPHVNLNRMLGYDQDEEGNWVVNEKQAEIVRHIFEQYNFGRTAGNIAMELNELGYRTINGKKWRSDGVYYILRNEKYVGDCEMQKYVSESFLEHKYQLNEGQAPRYYLADHHRGIISRQTWNQTQNRLQVQKNDRERKKRQKQEKGGGIFGNLKCPCGGNYMHTVYHGKIQGYTDERSVWAQGLDPEEYKEEYYYTYSIWRCGQKYAGHQKRGRLTEKERARAEKNCRSPILNEAAIKQSFMEMLYWMKREYEREGEEAAFIKEFNRAFEYFVRTGEGTDYSVNRLEFSRAKVKKLEEDYRAVARTQNAGIMDHLKAIQKQIDEERIFQYFLEEERDAAIVMKKNFELFLQCLADLPEADNQKADGGRTLFHFEKNIYRAFIQEGIVDGDVIRYKTVFGTELESPGNGRKMVDFLGYRKRNADGESEVIKEPFQVNDRAVGYRRNRKRERKLSEFQN